jgi:hypothetical protein
MMVKASETEAKPRGRERRKFDRFATRLPVATRRDDMLQRGRQGEQAECRIHVRDFSLGGLRADSPVRLRRNERLTLHVPAGLRCAPMQLTGRVVHCRRSDSRFEVGIQLCQTQDNAGASPYHHLPRLFSLAADHSPDAAALLD